MDEETCNYINSLTFDDLEKEPELAQEISNYQKNFELNEKPQSTQFCIGPSETSLLDILLVFTGLHSERVSWYKCLDTYFNQYTSNEINHTEYTSKNLDLTQKHKLFFHQSRALISNLKDPKTYNREDLAKYIEEILELETDLLKQIAFFQTATVLTSKTDKDYSQEAKEASERIPKTRGEISDLLKDLHEIMASLD